MRRTLLMVAVLGVLLGSALMKPQQAQSLPRPFWEAARIDYYGKVFHITTPFELRIEWVHGKGGVTIEQNGTEDGYTATQFPTSGSVILTGMPNGFGGYETAVYTVRTDQRDTIAFIHYRKK